ncbi:hypothetical protein, partial [Nesterenkonia sp. HG001]|uniref:hypothetical protein n=1 Tax=Nesterenkonia sp. HG001 TaxID=2983207 RepID=UPI002ACC1065
MRAGLAAAVVVGLGAPLSTMPAHADVEEQVSEIPAEVGVAEASDDAEQQDLSTLDEPGDDEPGDDEPGDDEPGDDEPGDDEPGDDEPGDDEPGDDEPGDDE